MFDDCLRFLLLIATFSLPTALLKYSVLVELVVNISKAFPYILIQLSLFAITTFVVVAPRKDTVPQPCTLPEFLEVKGNPFIKN